MILTPPSNDMPPPRLAGQRLMVGFDGIELTDTLKGFIRNFNLGGVILFKRNLQSPAQIRSLCSAIQDHARRCDLPPMFIGIDQEGGTVSRLPQSFTRFTGSSQMKSEAEAEAFGTITARELQSVNINMNMAPVLDVNSAGPGGVMRERSFGTDPQWVGVMGRRVIHTLQTGGIMAVGKHFPGIGRTTLDSHIDMPSLDIDRDELLKVDMVPFLTAINDGVAGMMLSHIRYPRIDAEWPASLSVPIARDLLRTELGYEGVVMTDDLDMGAIARHYGIETVIERVLAADIDIALICHEGPAIEGAFDSMVRAIEINAGLKHRSIESVQRILDLKRRYLESYKK